MGDITQKGTKSTLQRGTRLAQRQQRETYKTMRPVQQELFGQVLEALKTGGVGAQIPFIRRGVEDTRSATSSALRALESGPGANTPFGQRIRSQVATQGALQQARLPVEAAQSLISGAPGLIGQAGQTTAALGQQFTQGAGALAQQAKAGAQQKAQQTKQSIGQGVSGLALRCDLRLKTDIHRVGTAESGIGIYEFRYKGYPQRYRGPIAQDVLKIRPDAVERLPDGLLMVYTDKIDVPIVALPRS